MGTRRKPKQRQLRQRFSDRALDLYAKIRSLKCSCANKLADDCDGCNEFRALDCEITAVLKLPPWGPSLPTIRGHGDDADYELAADLDQALLEREHRLGRR
jgi:hypothetical protein